MKVELLHNTPLWVDAKAIRKCWDSEGNSDSRFDLNGLPFNHGNEAGEADKALINKIGNKFKHASTLEHLSYNFDIDGISRACLQELARHRISSFSVKSSRYTLKELKDEDNFFPDGGFKYDSGRVSKFVRLTGNSTVDEAIAISLNNLRNALANGISNDIAKYCMPESYKTSLVWTINARSLQNFLTLRTNKAALFEIRELANNIFNAIPDEHKYLFEHCIYTEEPIDG